MHTRTPPAADHPPVRHGHTEQVNSSLRADTATDVVAALAMPAPRAQLTQARQPLPLSELHRLPRDASMLYGIGRVDASGRVSERHIVQALGWKPGQRLDIVLIPRGIVIRSSTDGPTTLPATQRLVIPHTARRHCDIEAGDYVLLAAAPVHDLIIVHTAATLDDMLIQHHSSTLTASNHEQR